MTLPDATKTSLGLTSLSEATGTELEHAEALERYEAMLRQELANPVRTFAPGARRSVACDANRPAV